MKNKILLIGSLCLMVALGLVIGSCQNEVQTVEWSSMGAPKNVTAVYAAEVLAPYKQAHIKVTWDAVPDANGYQIVYQQDGKKNFTGTSGTRVNYTTTSGSIVDQDKYEYEVSAYSLPKGTFKIGVRASGQSRDKNASKPAWAPTTVTIP